MKSQSLYGYVMNARIIKIPMLKLLDVSIVCVMIALIMARKIFITTLLRYKRVNLTLRKKKTLSKQYHAKNASPSEADNLIIIYNHLGINFDY